MSAMIKLEALRVFVTVAEAGNIRDAAERLGRTPSAVSMALKQLEGEVGAPLFETDRKNMLTALGTFVFETARAQIEGFDRSIEAIRAYAEHRIGRLSLACVPSVAINLVPEVLRDFIAASAGVEVELFDVDSTAVAALVESGQVELGIGGQPPARATVEFTPLFSDRFALVCRADSPLASLRRPIDWPDLADEVLIRNGASDRLGAPQYRAMAHRAPLMVHNVNSLIAIVEAGLGVTLLPALSTAGLSANVRTCELADASATRVVGLIRRRRTSLSPVAATFVALLDAKLSGPLGARLGVELAH